jgi:bacterioferritin
MQGSPEIVRHLNDLLRGELAAINQYFLHASMYRNWGYHKLHKKMNEESIEEMKHAEKLMERILFLEGTPGMTGELTIRIGRNPQEMLENDLALEKEGLPEMRDGIALCLQQGDNVTRDLIERLLVDSEEHVFWLESQLHLIRQVGVENYCAQQI